MYIKRETLAEETKSLSVFLGGDNVFNKTSKESVLRIIDEQPTADVVEVEKVEKAREEILSRMNEFMSEYMKHGSGADYYAGKSESMETAIRLVRAVFTDLLDETKKEGAENENA